MENICGSQLPSPMALSYLGDGVHALLVREMLVGRGLSGSGELNEAARAYVTAEAQAVQARRVLPHLTESETDVYRRAHNSGHLNRPKRASAADYRAATGWEAVLGALWHRGETDRIRALFALATAENESQDHQEEKRSNDSED